MGLEHTGREREREDRTHVWYPSWCCGCGCCGWISRKLLWWGSYIRTLEGGAVVIEPYQTPRRKRRGNSSNFRRTVLFTMMSNTLTPTSRPAQPGRILHRKLAEILASHAHWRWSLNLRCATPPQKTSCCIIHNLGSRIWHVS